MGNKVKKKAVYTGFSGVSGFVCASTKAGLAREIGATVRMVTRAIESERGFDWVLGGDEKVKQTWWVSEVEVVKQEVRGVAASGASKIGKAC